MNRVSAGQFSNAFRWVIQCWGSLICKELAITANEQYNDNERIMIIAVQVEPLLDSIKLF